MSSVFKRFAGQYRDATNLQIVQSICDIYNSKLIKYTNGFVGKIARPKDVYNMPKKYLSINEYLSSNAQWKKILPFHSMLVKENIDISDYFDTMIKNWADISYTYNIKRSDRPIFSVIISKYGIQSYQKYKKLAENDTIANRARITDETFNRVSTLSPDNIKVDIDKLFNIKKLNDDLSYKEIVNLFSGDFSKKFKDIIDTLNEDDITKENIENYAFRKKSAKIESEAIMADMKNNTLTML